MSVAIKPSLSQFHRYCFEKNLPFAFYRLPEEKGVKVLAQKKRALSAISLSAQITAKGFVFAPFHENELYKTVFIQPEILCDENTLPALNFASKGKTLYESKKQKVNEADKADFLQQVKNIGKQIEKGKVDKIVAARIIKRKKPKGFDALKYFQLLCKRYPDAFVSLVFTPEYGLWIGASPEILLSVKNKTFQTISLAGTKEGIKLNGREWGKKEIQEQKIVSDYVLKTFSSFTKETPLIEGPKPVSAGNLMHLRTTFIYQSVAYKKWKAVVDQLHPTPAVAGFPKQKAIDFILRHEKDSRGFYSGYLGPVNLDGGINLFVNLRCMQVLKNNLLVYAGCGITAQSKPLEEWKESKIKAETLLSMLKVKKESKSFSPLPTHEHQQKGRAANSRSLPKKRNP